MLDCVLPSLPMAHSLQPSNFLFILIAFILQTSPGMCWLKCFTSIVNFGDSNSDPGNLLSLIPSAYGGKLPYGETFFGHPAGRFSDGRLIIDFLGALILFLVYIITM